MFKIFKAVAIGLFCFVVAADLMAADNLAFTNKDRAADATHSPADLPGEDGATDADYETFWESARIEPRHERPALAGFDAVLQSANAAATVSIYYRHEVRR